MTVVAMEVTSDGIASDAASEMSKFILGSGITGLLARHILGPEWKLIPFKRSRFYSFTPALADDYIVSTPEVATVLSSLNFLPLTRRYMKAFSYNGELIFSEQSFVNQLYNQKIFGLDAHPVAAVLTKTDLLTFKTTAGDLHDRLLDTYMNEIKTNQELYGDVINIDMNNRRINTSKGGLDYTKIVSTIPLTALRAYVGWSSDLPAANVWYYLVKTPSLNFEGANDVLVVDKAFDFFKVSHVGPQTYLFHCLRDLGNPGRYLGAFLNNNLEVQRQTQVTDALPLGPPQSMGTFWDIDPVGCHGQWDYFMDVSSSIKRLLRLKSSYA